MCSSLLIFGFPEAVIVEPGDVYVFSGAGIQHPCIPASLHPVCVTPASSTLRAASYILILFF